MVGRTGATPNAVLQHGAGGEGKHHGLGTGKAAWNWMQWGHEQECCLCDPGHPSTPKFTLAETSAFVPLVPFAVWTER